MSGLLNFSHRRVKLFVSQDVNFDLSLQNWGRREERLRESGMISSSVLSISFYFYHITHMEEWNDGLKFLALFESLNKFFISFSRTHSSVSCNSRLSHAKQSHNIIFPLCPEPLSSKRRFSLSPLRYMKNITLIATVRESSSSFLFLL